MAIIHKTTLLAVSLSALSGVRAAEAGVVYMESGNAGQTLATVQDVAVDGGIDAIQGTISTHSDADLFRVRFNQPGTISFTYLGVAAQLMVFDNDGHGIAIYVDPGAHSGSIPASFTASLAASSFLLIGISNGGVDPRDASNTRIFPRDALVANGPSNSNPFDHFAGSAVLQDVGQYVISFEPGSVSGVPSAGGLGLVCAAAVLGSGRRRGAPRTRVAPSPAWSGLTQRRALVVQGETVFLA